MMDMPLLRLLRLMVWGTMTVWSIFQNREGRLWFATYGGVSRYDEVDWGDGKTFTTFTTKDRLIHDAALSISQDGEGNLWFGTEEGVSRLSPDTSGAKSRQSEYDGQTWRGFTTADGLAGDVVGAIAVDGAGDLWFGNWGFYKLSYAKGVSRYDGKTFTTFTTKDGLVNNKCVVAFRGQGRCSLVWHGEWCFKI